MRALQPGWAGRSLRSGRAGWPHNALWSLRPSGALGTGRSLCALGSPRTLRSLRTLGPLGAGWSRTGHGAAIALAFLIRIITSVYIHLQNLRHLILFACNALIQRNKKESLNRRFRIQCQYIQTSGKCEFGAEIMTVF